MRQLEKAGELRVFDGKILRPPAGASRPTPVSLRSWPFTVCLRFFAVAATSDPGLAAV